MRRLLMRRDIMDNLDMNIYNGHRCVRGQNNRQIIAGVTFERGYLKEARRQVARLSDD